MARTFGGATSDRINIGSAAAIDDLTAAAYLMWVNPTTLTANRILFAKTDGVSSNRRLLLLSGTGGNLDFRVIRATTNTQYVTSSTPLSATGSWIGLAIVFDTSAGAGEVVNIYSCPSTTFPVSLTEATYSTATDGSGALTSDAAGSFLWGNGAALNVSIQAGIAYAALFSVAPSKATCETWFNYANGVQTGCQGFYQLGLTGAASEEDFSGNGNTGGVTGTSIIAMPPFGPPHQRRERGTRGAFRGMAA